jgi:radical SAM superfamily enzyme
VKGCRKTKEAGISSSLYVMPGLGGSAWSEEHATETARVITDAEPDFVRLRTLEIFPGTGLSAALKSGEFTEATEEEVAREIRTLMEKIAVPTNIVSDSASNLLSVNGNLPTDRTAMLDVIDQYLALSPRQRLLFSFHSRLQSFIGQYGGVTEDIVTALSPYVEGSSLHISGAPDGDVARITRLIRSKLMP